MGVDRHRSNVSTNVNTFERVHGSVGMTKRQLQLSSCCPSVLEAALDEDQAVLLAKAFAALSDPARLRLLSLVAAEPEVCACELVEPLGKSQPTVSHHLKVLFEVGLVALSLIHISEP